MQVLLRFIFIFGNREPPAGFNPSLQSDRRWQYCIRNRNICYLNLSIDMDADIIHSIISLYVLSEIQTLDGGILCKMSYPLAWAMQVTRPLPRNTGIRHYRPCRIWSRIVSLAYPIRRMPLLLFLHHYSTKSKIEDVERNGRSRTYLFAQRSIMGQRAKHLHPHVARRCFIMD